MNYFNQESERLSYRKLTRDDIPTWTTFFIDNDRLKFLGIDITKAPEVLATDWIETQFKRYDLEGLGHLAVEIKESGEFIGVGGIIPRVLNKEQEYEIAYSLIPKFWKKGYGTELANQMRKYGLANIDSPRLISIIDKANSDSINVAKKNKMSILFETQFLGMDVFVFGVENKK